MIEAPDGFVREQRGESCVILAREITAAAIAAGLDRPWALVQPRPEGPGTGRGPRAVIALPGGPSILVKQYLRGGVLARWNPERYFAIHRFARELAVGRSARAAGVPCGEPLGVVLAPTRPGWRAWGLSRYIDGARDLARLLHEITDPAARSGIWSAALDAVASAHERGLEHRDLNLGNLVARQAADGAWEFFLVDLDRAFWWGGPVPAQRRRAVLARLARSHRKIFGTEPPPA